MRLIELEEVTLYRLHRNTAKDGDPVEQYEEMKKYSGAIQYLDDSVSASIYGAEVTKTYRVSTLYHGLEKFLLPKINNNPDNLSNYLIDYSGNKFKIQRVTPKYLDISWR